MYSSTPEQRRGARVQALAEQLYRERYHYLLRIARRNGAGAYASDAVNDVFASFISKFDPDCDAPPLAWITLCLKRACWAAYRAQHLDRSAGQETATDSEGRGFSAESIPSQAAGPEQLLEWVQEARAKLAALKPAERRTLSLLAAGYSYAEVGQITSFSYTYADLRVMPTSVRKAASRAEIALMRSA